MLEVAKIVEQDHCFDVSQSELQVSEKQGGLCLVLDVWKIVK
jgi:hypothetical protein